MSKDYVVRGKMTDGSVERITLFDGRFDTAYRIVEFKMFTSTPSASDSDGWGTLATEETSATSAWNASDNSQIGWTGFHTTTFGAGYEPQQILDKETLIVEDLYVYGNSAGNHDLNYFIRLEKVSISDWQGALAMVRNRSQA